MTYFQTDTNKCWSCSKKVGLIKVTCKCSYVFCAKHRLAEDHNCSFDYFKEQQQKLLAQNPTIAHQKLEKIH